jgi:glycosyltransferase involved in cell wall biosynthesis
MSEVAEAPLGWLVETETLDVTVVLPCLNEEQSVGLCVTEALAAISRAGWTGEVVVVDNGCDDRSAEVAAAAGARVVSEPVRGYGAAILRGIRSARSSVVVMADADCTYPLDELAKVAGPVLEGEAELVLASRLDGATRQSMPLLHRFVGTPALTWLVRAGTGVGGLTDSQSGYRAFKSSLIDRLGLRATGMEFASEMLIKAAQRRVTVREVPLGYRTRVGESKLSTWRDGLRHLRLILRLSPHLLLWWPGLAAMAAGWLIYGATLVDSGGASVGSLTW